MRLFITGGAGFIGSALIRYCIGHGDHEVINIDKLTYAGNLDTLQEVSGSRRYHFEQVDICDGPAIAHLYQTYRPDAIMHLAAESHVDRSIDGPADFIRTNVVGTATLLEASRQYWQGLQGEKRALFRFHHISTDEVYGSLGKMGSFTEETPYRPSSPYSASKASSDHLVRAWYHTYGLPILITNCSNNYGPFQFPEKLIPLMLINALAGKPLPVYGKGENVRDWLYVDDHVAALLRVLQKGVVGETYNIGGHNEKTNLEVVKMLCSHLDTLRPNAAIGSYENLITFVADRPGHDLRYAIDATKIQRELDWRPRETFETGLKKTVRWYLDNEWWWKKIQAEKYAGQRLGQEIC